MREHYKGRIENLEKEVERLRESEDRLTLLLRDALQHTPESYHRPIMEVLRRKAKVQAAEAAGDE